MELSIEFPDPSCCSARHYVLLYTKHFETTDTDTPDNNRSTKSLPFPSETCRSTMSSSSRQTIIDAINEKPRKQLN